MSRLDIDRQNRLEPHRLKTAVQVLSNMGFDVSQSECGKSISFIYKGEIITYWVYSGWASGKTIKDGRGLVNLVKQLKL